MISIKSDKTLQIKDDALYIAQNKNSINDEFVVMFNRDITYYFWDVDNIYSELDTNREIFNKDFEIIKEVKSIQVE